jgi:hypothetical protein
MPLQRHGARCECDVHDTPRLDDAYMDSLSLSIYDIRLVLASLSLFSHHNWKRKRARQRIITRDGYPIQSNHGPRGPFLLRSCNILSTHIALFSTKLSWHLCADLDCGGLNWPIMECYTLSQVLLPVETLARAEGRELVVRLFP